MIQAPTIKITCDEDECDKSLSFKLSSVVKLEYDDIITMCNRWNWQVTLDNFHYCPKHYKEILDGIKSRDN